MEEYAYVTPLLASAFYLIASVRLFDLHRRTDERPELLLALYFALSGLFYLGYNIPSLFQFDAWPPLVGIAIEWVYNLGVFPYLFFIRSVFRSDDAWAGWLVGVCSMLLLAGGLMLTAAGSVDYSLSNPWFIVQWIGYTTPCAWMCWEAMLARHGAQKRARLGLSQPLVVNRYLLLALFGGFQVLACLSDLSLANDISSTQAVSTISNVLVGGTEIASVAVLWLAFLPPRFYRRWIDGRAALRSAPAEEG